MIHFLTKVRLSLVITHRIRWEPTNTFKIKSYLVQLFSVSIIQRKHKQLRNVQQFSKKKFGAKLEKELGKQTYK